MAQIESRVSDSNIRMLCEQIRKYNYIAPADFDRFNVKRGLRNSDGTGVMAGITRVCSVEGYYLDDGEKVPREGRLKFRGIDMESIVNACIEEDRFGFEEVVYLLLFGNLPDKAELEKFTSLIADYRQLPSSFVRDIVMKCPSNDIMNTLARSVLTLFAYDENPSDLSIPNVLRQSLELIALFPMLAVYAYQVKLYYMDNKGLVIHQPRKNLSVAENILHLLRADSRYTELEARVLDLALVLHAEHGGGNNSTFTMHVVTSSGTDTYSAVAAALSSLKGPKHGGANLKVMGMMDDLRKNVRNIEDREQIETYLKNVLDKKAFDHEGLIYGMGHAVYSKSDPRAEVFKSFVEKLSIEKHRQSDFKMYSIVEEIAPGLILERRKNATSICANVDFYSGFVYDMLDIPRELYTPLFAIARIVGWSAHRMEELITSNKILRPAYVNIDTEKEYIDLDDRE